MHICALDPEMEYEDLTNNLGGCFIDLMSGEFIINPLEPKTWDEAGSPEDLDAPQTFRIRSRLSQHISFLKDFFRSYKDFSDREIDVIEIMLQKLYTRWGLQTKVILNAWLRRITQFSPIFMRSLRKNIRDLTKTEDSFIQQK